MKRKTANQLRAEARNLMDKAKRLEEKNLIEAGKQAQKFHQAKINLEELRSSLNGVFGEAPLQPSGPSKPQAKAPKR